MIVEVNGATLDTGMVAQCDSATFDVPTRRSVDVSTSVGRQEGRGVPSLLPDRGFRLWGLAT